MCQEETVTELQRRNISSIFYKAMKNVRRIQFYFWVCPWPARLTLRKSFTIEGPKSPKIPNKRVYMKQQFIFFYWWVVFLFMYIPYFVYPITCLWTFGLPEVFIHLNNVTNCTNVPSFCRPMFSFLLNK